MSGPYDAAISSNTSGSSSFGSQSLRMSNATTSGSFGDWLFSPSLTNEAGETAADNGGLSGGVRQNHFETSWDIASATPNSYQPDLQISASPDRGDGARMSFLRFRDTLTGLAVDFADYQSGVNETGCAAGSNFITTTVAQNLNRTQTHNIRLSMDFVDGANNDVVKVYVDNVLVHTGTSWEGYFNECEHNPTRTVDSVLFQARDSGGTAPLTVGNGFLIDNFSEMSSTLTSPTSKDSCKNGGWANMNNPSFKNQGLCVSWVEHNILGNGTPAANKPGH